MAGTVWVASLLVASHPSFARPNMFTVSGASLPDMVSGKALAAHVELFGVA